MYNFKIVSQSIQIEISYSKNFNRHVLSCCFKNFNEKINYISKIARRDSGSRKKINCFTRY